MALGAANGAASGPSTESPWASRLIPVEAPAASETAAERGRWLAEQLERGHILFFARSPFPITEDERAFLLAQKQTDAGYHKNIAYRPGEDRLTGTGKMPATDAERLAGILRTYSERAGHFLAALLPPYGGAWRKDFASYRAIEEEGRQARLTARNDLAHVDAFPTRPTHGDRILRVFTNINPARGRVWVTSDTFEGLAQRFALQAGIPQAAGGAALSFARLARALGLRQWDRSPYDAFMLRFHDFLKQSREFQEHGEKKRWEFPPHSSWICYTDTVSHAVLSGQYALEQTFIVSQKAMVLPEQAPIRILERICGHRLSNRS
jgi:hypothetical protein